jgi:hypothetical protein
MCDSSLSTARHIKLVGAFLVHVASELLQRGLHHDESKLYSIIENTVEHFNRYEIGYDLLKWSKD